MPHFAVIVIQKTENTNGNIDWIFYMRLEYLFILQYLRH